MFSIRKFIRKWKAFRLSLRLLRLIDPKRLEDINIILEDIYPGIRAEIQTLVESHDIHAMSKTLQYINTHGGTQKMADYYNSADKNGKEAMLSAFNKVFYEKRNYVDGLLYELRNPQYDENGQVISTEISARSNGWNIYSDSSERMMNRICHHLDANLVPDYCPLDEHLGVDEERRTFVRALLFSAENRNR